MDKLASLVSTFSSKFCNELDEAKNSKSLIVSPLSVEVLLALLTLGASEPAHSELLNSLGLESNDDVRKSFKSLSANLKNVKGITLNVANKIYIKQGDYELVPALQTDAVEVFDAAFEKINFDDSAAAANSINQWVESKTNNRIKDLLESSDLSGDTKLVLINALYFKGNWAKQFNLKNTHDQEFFVTADTKVKIPMMYQESTFKYGECDELDAQFLEMQYEGGQASMLIVLPRTVDGLPQVMKKLAEGYNLMEKRSNLGAVKVQVTIPKFKIETTVDLKNLLPKLGINAIFDSKRSGLNQILSSGEELFVSKAIQKAFIEVNEEGAEAAAATGVVMMLRCAMMTPEFRADRPFFYAMLGADNATLFAAFAVAAMCCLMEPPTPSFTANHPFLATLIHDDITYFFASFAGH